MSLVKLLPAWLHAVADYAVGFSLIIVSLAASGPDRARGVGIFVGVVVLVVSALTKYPLGIIKVLPFTVHSPGDYLAAAILILSPFVLGFRTMADHAGNPGLAAFYIVAGLAVLGVSLITNYQYSPKRQVVTAAMA